LIPPAPAAKAPVSPQDKPAEPARPEPAQEAKAEPDISPEVIYFTRYYAAGPGSGKLEDKISEVSAAAGGKYSSSDWQAKRSGPDMYETMTVVPAKDGNMTFTFVVDYAKKTLRPVDPAAQSAFDALIKSVPAPAKKTARKANRKNTKSADAAPAPAPKATPKAAAARPAAGPEDEYEYVYEEE
jgi:hypothetical protein